MKATLLAKHSLDEFYEKNKDNKILNVPDKLFQSISKIIPVVNTDLLVKNSKGEILLSWRDDTYSGNGWHVPGRIIRIKETFVDCLNRCAEMEIEVPLIINGNHIDVNEIIYSHKTVRSHFISFLYEAFMEDQYVNKINVYKKEGQVGFLKWFKECPDDLIEGQSLYRKYFNGK